jgi:hypothetical protein
MNPKEIAKLITEDPDVVSETVYHVTSKDNLNSIMKSGLNWTTMQRTFKPGKGVYVFKDFEAWPIVANWLSLDDPAILEIDLDPDDPAMLMDEDAISGLATTDISEEFYDLYPELAKELEATLGKVIEEHGWQENLLALAKTEFIDKHKIPPSGIPSMMHRSLVQAGRYPKAVPASLIKKIYHEPKGHIRKHLYHGPKDEVEPYNN